MTNWDKTFNSLSDDELNDLAVLRIIETSNGIVQYMFRDKAPDALPVEETRALMGFSMSSIKRQQIVLDSETIEFSPEVKEIMTKVRDLYVSGMKHNNDEDYEDTYDDANEENTYDDEENEYTPPECPPPKFAEI